MYTLTFQLKQHTPLIHFQHDQDGATLRATEVKPKLDRFIFKKFGNTDSLKLKHPEWFQKNKNRDALDYSVSIVADNRNTEFSNLIDITYESGKKIEYKNLPGFFGNMMKTEDYRNKIKHPKKVSFYKNITLEILSPHKTLNDFIKSNISDFFLTENFGCRQTKGFGSFSIDNDDIELNKSLFYKSFVIEASDFFTLFQKIEYFYKAIRSGINIKIKKNDRATDVIDKFYMKSLLYWYFKQNFNVQWEKRTIKEHWFNADAGYKGLQTQAQERSLNANDQSGFSSESKFIIKDLLGLASEESWRSYNNAIIKKISVHEEVERYRSPITFKIIHVENNKYKIYIILDTNPAINGHSFRIEYLNNHFTLNTHPNFNIQSYLNWIFDPNNIDLKSYISSTWHTFVDKKRICVYKCLESIFTQLQYS